MDANIFLIQRESAGFTPVYSTIRAVMWHLVVAFRARIA
jgi:hypothetical protein